MLSLYSLSLLILLGAFGAFIPKHAYAQSISNSSFELVIPPSSLKLLEDFDREAKEPISPNTQKKQARYFTFSLSVDKLDYGKVIAAEPIMRSVTLSAKNGNENGYQIFAQENTVLTDTTTGSKIPDTTCDSGVCSERQSDVWSNPLTYGFGYRCEDEGKHLCNNLFQNNSNYMQFASKDLREEPMPIMTSFSSQEFEAKMITKLNISGSQSPGTYQNRIEIISISSF